MKKNTLRRWPWVVSFAALLAACSSAPPPPDWQMNARSSAERAAEAWLSGNTKVEEVEFLRARGEVARTAQPALLARLELTRCATRVAALVFEPCAGFQALAVDAAPAEQAYARYLAGQALAADAALLPEAQRPLALAQAEAPPPAQSQAAIEAALARIQDPLSRLVAAGVLLQRGLATPEQLSPQERKEDSGPPKAWEERVWVLSFSDKLRLLFEAEHPGLREVRTLPVWVVGDLVQFGGDFVKYISGRDLAKQEGLIFRHCLRMVLLCGEFANVTPDGMDPSAWRAEMRGLADLLTDSCRSVDPESTDQMLENVAAADVVAGEDSASPKSVDPA